MHDRYAIRLRIKWAAAVVGSMAAGFSMIALSIGLAQYSAAFPIIGIGICVPTRLLSFVIFMEQYDRIDFEAGKCYCANCGYGRPDKWASVECPECGVTLKNWGWEILRRAGWL